MFGLLFSGSSLDLGDDDQRKAGFFSVGLVLGSALSYMLVWNILNSRKGQLL